MTIGWIKLHRQITEWEWSDCPNTFCLFMHLLLRANYEINHYHGYEIPVGSLVCGRKSLSADSGLSEQQIRTALDRLKSSNEITIKTTNKFSIISMVNWSKYQGDNQQDNQRVTNNQPTSNQQVTTLKEVKKKRNKEDNNLEGVGKPTKTNKGIRLDDFLEKLGKQDIPQAWGEWAYKEMLINADSINWEWDKFYDYWTALSGQKGFKLDWFPAWKNWIRKHCEDKQRKESLNEIYARKR